MYLPQFSDTDKEEGDITLTNLSCEVRDILSSSSHDLRKLLMLRKEGTLKMDTSKEEKAPANEVEYEAVDEEPSDENILRPKENEVLLSKDVQEVLDSIISTVFKAVKCSGKKKIQKKS